jgi:hypothetical protein
MKARERRWRAAGASLLLLMTMGCAGTTVGQPQPAEFVDPVLGVLNKGIIQLDVNIDWATKRLQELKQFLDTQDTVLQELRAMDLLGLDLHQQQWVLQRNHLHFAKAQMLASMQNPDNKARLLQEWTTHERQYRQDMDAFRQKRLDLERKRLTVEAQLIERSLK